MNKYHDILEKIMRTGKMQHNKKGNIKYLLNEQLSLSPADLLDIFESHGIARKKLKNELQLFMQGERQVEKYREAGINWWDYCGSVLVNSYPTYFAKLPPLIARINREKRNSKNYVLFLGETNAESNQAPCLSLVQFQINEGELVVSAYQRSSDANLGLPADIYHLYLMSRQIELPLKSITLNLANVHIYESNIGRTQQLLDGNENVRFELNVYKRGRFETNYQIDLFCIVCVFILLHFVLLEKFTFRFIKVLHFVLPDLYDAWNYLRYHSHRYWSRPARSPFQWKENIGKEQSAVIR